MKYMISFLTDNKFNNGYVAGILSKYCKNYYGQVSGLIFFESDIGMDTIRDGLNAKNLDFFHYSTPKQIQWQTPEQILGIYEGWYRWKGN